MFYSALTAFAALLLSAPALAGYISVWHFNGQYICELSDGVLQSCPLSGGVLVNGDSPSCNDLLNNGYGTEPNLFYEYPKTPDYFNGPCPCGGGMLDFYKRGDTFEVYWAGGDGTSLGFCNSADMSKTCATSGTFAYRRDFTCQLSACC